jgi:signal peptidase complex subunit 3
MHNLVSRLNSLFAFTITTLGALAFCLYASSSYYTSNNTVKLDTNRIAVKYMTEFTNGKKRNDLGFLNFDMNVDLEPLFNWNVKQLFLYLTAEYETDHNALNQVVIWDKIVLKGENYKLQMKNAKSKYYLWDDGNGLKGNKNVTIYLSWNVVPNVGGLPNIAGTGNHQIRFPSNYASNQ